MKGCKVLIGLLFAALVVMGAQSATAADSTSDSASAVVGGMGTVLGNIVGSGAGAGFAATAAYGRMDDGLSTMMAVYNQRRENLSRKLMSQPKGPAGPGSFVGGQDVHKAWGRYMASWGDQDSIDAKSGYDFVSHGPVFGYDRFVTEKFMVGGLLGYARTEVEVDGGHEVDVNSYFAGAYGTYLFSDVDYLNVLFSYGRSNIDIAAGTLSGDTDANGWIFAGEYGHKFLVKNSLVLTPFAGLVVNMVDVEGYTTNGANKYSDSRNMFYSSKLGVKGDWLFSPTGTLKMKALWLHEFSEDLETVAVVDSTTVKGIDPGQDKGQFGLGVKYGLANGLVLDIDGDFTVGEDYSAWTTAGKVQYPF